MKISHAPAAVLVLLGLAAPLDTAWAYDFQSWQVYDMNGACILTADSLGSDGSTLMFMESYANQAPAAALISNADWDGSEPPLSWSPEGFSSVQIRTLDEWRDAFVMRIKDDIAFGNITGRSSLFSLWSAYIVNSSSERPVEIRSMSGIALGTFTTSGWREANDRYDHCLEKAKLVDLLSFS